MIELALGAAAAALFAKALDRAGEKTVDRGEGALCRLVKLVKDRLSADEKGAKALEKMQGAPSPSGVEALGQLLNEQTKDDPEFRRELEALIEEAKGSGISVEGIVQATYGDQSPQVGVVSGGEVNVTFGGEGGKNPPRRLSD
jgi:hypothetical protein